MKRQNFVLENGICVQMNDPENEHFHDEFELLYLAQGKARIRVDRKEYVLLPGSMVFIGKLEGHSIQMLSEDYLYYYLILNSRQLEKVIREPRLISVFRNRPAAFEHVIHMQEYAEELTRCFEEIRREMERKDIYFNELVYTNLTKILICAYRTKPAEFGFMNTQRNADIYDIEKYLEEYLHLKDNLLALILPGLINIFNMLVMRSFVSDIPAALIESAKMDGAGEFRSFLQIVVPLLKSGLATIGLFIALGYWNDWFNAMLYINSDSKYPLQYMLYDMLQQAMGFIAARAGIPTENIPTNGLKLAMAVVATGPIILLYPFVQKYFVKGITIGAVKG